jgi:hypothetical protein
MKALIVYESMFGNTEQVARAIAVGLKPDLSVELVGVKDAPAAIHELVDLVVVGGPTHAFSLSRPSTRAEAEKKGAAAASSGGGIREWLQGLPEGPHSESIATFDTRATKARHLPGSAAAKAARLARQHGYPAAFAQESFWVEDTAGPLQVGELERAVRWGRALAAWIIARSTGVVTPF